MDTTTTTTQKSYVCNGTCGGSVSEAEYNGGKTLCGTEGCSMQGQPFVEKVTETTEVSRAGDDDVIINNG